MPVREIVGDIFESGAQTLVNTVTTKGVMGKGLALAFKERYPDVFADYRRRCQSGEVRVGRPYIYKPANPRDPWVINFPTKDHWRYPSRLEWIHAGLEHIATNYQVWGVHSIAFPRLGTQNGGLSWSTVRATMLAALEPLDLEIFIYAPGAREVDHGALAFLNDASEEQLVQRCAVAPDLARRIVEQRSVLGGFDQVDQLLTTKRLGPKTLRKILSAAEAAPSFEQRQLL